MASAQEMATEFQALLSFLLYEKKQETQLSGAFGALVQERHNQFHTDSDDKVNGDGTTFYECGSDVCIQAKRILDDARTMSVELNEFGIEMISSFNLRIVKGQRSCRAWLEKKEASLIIPGGR